MAISNLYGGYSLIYGVSNILGISFSLGLYITFKRLSKPIVPKPILACLSFFEPITFLLSFT